MVEQNGAREEHSMTRPGIFQNNIISFTIIAVVLLLMGFVITPVLGFSHDFVTKRPTPIPTRTDAQIWGDWSQVFTSNHPELQSKPDLEKAKLLFSLYSASLVNENVPLNSNQMTRFQDLWWYTCQWHTENLMAIFNAAGIKNVHSILADKDSYNILNSTGAPGRDGLY